MVVTGGSTVLLSIFLEMILTVPGDVEDHLLECSVLSCRSMGKKQCKLG